MSVLCLVPRVMHPRDIIEDAWDWWQRRVPPLYIYPLPVNPPGFEVQLPQAELDEEATLRKDYADGC